MRIISGELRGRRFVVPGQIPARPTTDFAKTGLFNILDNKIDYEACTILDLFHGTGSISIEFASRGCNEIVAIDNHTGCHRFLAETAKQLSLPITALRADVLKSLPMLRRSFEIVFADPPYDWPHYMDLIQNIFSLKLLKEEGLLIVEHDARHVFTMLPSFIEERKYGNVHFSFFQMASLK